MKIFGLEINKIKDIPKEEKASRTAILNTQYGTAKWMDKNYENYMKETYMKNVISFRCIFYVATCMAQVKWGLFQEQDTERTEITNTDINKVLKRANQLESYVALIQKVISYLMITGNAYIEKIMVGKKIKELWSLRPDKIVIKLNPQTGQIGKFVYDDKIEFEVNPVTLKSDLLQIKLFNPIDDFFGMSITEPTAREIDSSNEAIEWQKKMFENEGRPGMAVLVNGFLTDAQFDKLEKQMNDKYRGSGNAGRTIILEGENSTDIKPYSWSPKEMDWIESNRELARRVCLGYGVPPMLLGIPGDNTYANLQEARAALWEETITYYLNLLKGELNNWLFDDDKMFLDYDISQVPAMAYKQEIIWNRIKEASFMTINEKREAVGMESIEGGDTLFVPFGQVPIEQALMTDENTGTEMTEDEENDEVDELVNEGFDEETAKQMIGIKY